MGTDNDMLVDGGKPAEDGVILDPYVPRQRRPVGHDHAIADMAVVCRMAVGHEQVAVPHGGFSVTGHGTGMDRDELPDE